MDEYLAAVPEPARGALEALHAAIRTAAPQAVEVISYGMPAFKQDGRFLVSYAAHRRHCSLYPASGGVMAALRRELEPYFSGKGTLRFTPDAPIPADLVRRLVAIRLEEVRRGSG